MIASGERLPAALRQLPELRRPSLWWAKSSALQSQEREVE